MRRVGGAILSAGVLIASGLAAGDTPEERIRAMARAAGQKAPVLRIGLGHRHRIPVGSRNPFRIVDAASGKAVWKEQFEGELHVVAEGGPTEAVPSIFRIQVGAFGDADAAQAELDRLSARVGAPGVVHHDPDRGNWRVRLGRADDRLGLVPLMETLRGLGMQDIWIAEESAEALRDVSLRLVDGSYDSFASGLTRVVLVPSGGGRVEVDGVTYRGVVELRVSPYGTVRPVNWIELEQYLLGVVPAELGPEVWPEIEALRAQAVAARTYAWRNRNQFSDEGFDLCATPRCQVYKGYPAEHPLSDRAVRSTKGEVLAWEGRPIVALYTATCGGHTEDGREIFAEHDEPYLRGVPCRAESDALATQGATIAGRAPVPVKDETGADVTRAWSLLSTVGVVDAGAARALEPLDGGGLRAATRTLTRLSGVAEAGEADDGALDLGRAAELLLADTGWAERARVLMDGEDLPALLRDEAIAELGTDGHRAMAYLARLEALQPFPDGRYRPEGPATLARLAPALVRIGETYDAFDLASGVVTRVGADHVRLVQGKGSVRRPLAPGPSLFGWSGGRSVPVGRLDLWPGDRVRFRTNGSGAIDFLELMPPVKGLSDDRSSKYYSWEVRRSRRQLEVAINRRVSIGRLKDLQAVRRGVSGRVVELKVVGSKGETVVRGFDVRRLLDLRETLLVIEIQRDAKGEIDAVVFAGKGWGHGVGLCQVGAYGMALRGAGYREILGHYYSGAALEKLAAVRR